MKASDFTKYLLEQVDNHSFYVWGGQGEPFSKQTYEDLKKKESDEKHLSDIYFLAADNIIKGYDLKNARCFDCSGLGVYFFLKNNIIKSDLTADGLYRICDTKIPVAEVVEGDFVFKNKSSSGAWGHIGYVVKYADTLKVVEAKGRAYGVVISTLTSGWKAATRPSWWEAETYVFTQTLRKGSRGEDVKQLQLLLIQHGYSITADGSFGTKTETAVKDFQKKSKLTVDGVAGKKTITALGGIWG